MKYSGEKEFWVLGRKQIVEPPKKEHGYKGQGRLHTFRKAGEKKTQLDSLSQPLKTPLIP